MGLFSSGFLIHRKRISVKAGQAKVWRGRFFGGDSVQDLKRTILYFWMANFVGFVLQKGGNCRENRKLGTRNQRRNNCRVYLVACCCVEEAHFLVW
jgi:hypothetical protein